MLNKEVNKYKIKWRLPNAKENHKWENPALSLNAYLRNTRKINKRINAGKGNHDKKKYWFRRVSKDQNLTKSLNEWGYEIVKDKEVFTVQLRHKLGSKIPTAAVLYLQKTTYQADYLPRNPVQTFFVTL